MRLGGPLLSETRDPGESARAIRGLGYTAASFQLATFYDCKTIFDGLIKAFAAAAAKADITIAEVAIYCLTFPDEEERKKSIDQCCACLEIANRIGARCAVSVAGERIPRATPGGPSPIKLNAETFDIVVANTRTVIDRVRPTHTYFAYQTMGWVYPNSPDNVVKLFKAVDRERFAAHLDITNLINGADRYFGNTDFVRECFAKFGAKIRNCHVKDVVMTIDQPIRIMEVRRGTSGRSRQKSV